MNIFCYSCDKQLEFTENDKISRREECVYCNAPLHCCTMCQFYDTSTYNDCREPMANRVAEKTKANFCTYFRLAANRHAVKADRNTLISAAEALFKKS